MKKNFLLFSVLFLGFGLFMESCSNHVGNEIVDTHRTPHKALDVPDVYGCMHNDILSFCLSKFSTLDTVSIASYVDCVVGNTITMIYDWSGYECSNCVEHVLPPMLTNNVRFFLDSMNIVLGDYNSGTDFVPVMYRIMKDTFEEIAHDTTSSVLTTRTRLCNLKDLLLEQSQMYKTDDTYEQAVIATQIMLSSYDYWTNYSNLLAWSNESYAVSPREHVIFDDITLSTGKMSDGTKTRVLRFVKENASGALLGYRFGGPYGAVAIGSIFSALEALSWD